MRLVPPSHAPSFPSDHPSRPFPSHTKTTSQATSRRVMPRLPQATIPPFSLQSDDPHLARTKRRAVPYCFFPTRASTTIPPDTGPPQYDNPRRAVVVRLLTPQPTLPGPPEATIRPGSYPTPASQSDKPSHLRAQPTRQATPSPPSPPSPPQRDTPHRSRPCRAAPIQPLPTRQPTPPHSVATCPSSPTPSIATCPSSPPRPRATSHFSP